MPVTLKNRIPQIQASLPLRVGAAVRETAEAIADKAAQDAPDRDPRWKGLPESIEARSGEISYGHRSAFGTHAAALGFTAPTVENASRQAGVPLKRSTVVSDVAYGVWAAWYWHFPEFGTAEVAARPYMMPAAEAEREGLEHRARAALRRL